MSRTWTSDDAPLRHPPIEAWELLEALPPDRRKEFLLECYCADVFTWADVQDCFARWPEMREA